MGEVEQRGRINAVWAVLGAILGLAAVAIGFWCDRQQKHVAVVLLGVTSAVCTWLAAAALL